MGIMILVFLILCVLISQTKAGKRLGYAIVAFLVMAYVFNKLHS